MDAFLARQAILDRNQNVIGYEILFRSSGQSTSYDGLDGSQATSRVIANSVFALGLDRVLAGKRGFINFTEDLLLNGYADVLPKQVTVIEILETVPPNPNVIAACQDLKARGYSLALDDFVCEERYEPLAKLADFIKVDFQATSQDEQRRLAQRYGSRGVKMLAEKVETIEQFEWARSIGYLYAQGYFFARPVILSGREPPAFKPHYHSLLREIHSPDLDHRRIEQAIKRELSLAYKLVRYINSARFDWSRRVDSIQHALVLLGEDGIRKWATLVIVSGLGENKPRELVVIAMLRARFCELLGSLAQLNYRSTDLFLMGMFSLLDAIMDRKLEDVLAELHLGEEISAALLGTASSDNPLAAVYTLVCAYEAGRWDAVSLCARRLNVPEHAISGVYLDSVEWSEQIFDE